MSYEYDDLCRDIGDCAIRSVVAAKTLGHVSHHNTLMTYCHVESEPTAELAKQIILGNLEEAVELMGGDEVILGLQKKMLGEMAGQWGLS